MKRVQRLLAGWTGVVLLFFYLPIAWVLAGGYTRDVAKVVAVHVGTFDAAQSVFG